jgi:hypothetical protein
LRRFFPAYACPVPCSLFHLLVVDSKLAFTANNHECISPIPPAGIGIYDDEYPLSFLENEGNEGGDVPNPAAVLAKQPAQQKKLQGEDLFG